MNKYNFLDLYKTYKRCSIYKNISDINELIIPLQKIGLWYFAVGTLNVHNELSLFVSDSRVAECYADNPGLMYEEPHFLPTKLLSPGEYHANQIFTKVYPYVTPQHYKSFTIINDHISGEREVFHFSLNKENFNDYETLRTFVPKFKDKAGKLITKADKFFMPVVCSNANPLETIKQLSLMEVQLNGANRNCITSAYYNYCKNLQIATMHNCSHREAQCLNLILQGKLDKQIADVLRLSPKTIEVYINNLKYKLGCRNKGDIAIKALSFDVTSAAPWLRSMSIFADGDDVAKNIGLHKADKCIRIAQQYKLSLREIQCLDLILHGKLDKQISDILGLSNKTIESYIGKIKNKLRCRTKIDIILKTLM